MKTFIPHTCPDCETELKIITGKNDKYKLICPNDKCFGVLLKRFQSGMLVFQISGLGPATLKNLYLSGVRDIADLLSLNKEAIFEQKYFKDGRAFDKMMTSIQNIKTLRLKHIIESLQFEDVGSSVSEEIEKYMNGSNYDFTGIEYSTRDLITNPESILIKSINEMIVKITEIGISIDMGKKEKSGKEITYECTGSPENYGFKTKDIFEAEVAKFGCVRTSLTSKTNYLITDDLASTTGKMGKAIKNGIPILDYGQFYKMVSV
jgi:DNA ligase (NAD+)